MQVNVPTSKTTSQPTGQLQGLPDKRTASPEQAKVKPIADARNPEAELKEGLVPTKFWRAAIGKPDPSANAAPPSIMQITISRMLDAQNTGKAPATIDQHSTSTSDSVSSDKRPHGPEVKTLSVGHSAEGSEDRRSILSTLP